MSLANGWRPDTPVGDSVLRRFLFNQADLGDLIADAVGGRRTRTAEVAMADVGVPVPYLNQAVLLAPVLAADSPVLTAIDEFFATGHHPAIVLSAWPTPDLTSRGWILVGHPMFVLRAPAEHAFRSNTGVAVRVAHTAADLATAEAVAVRGYPLPEADGLRPNALFGPGLLGGALRVRFAAVEGTPAAIGSSHVAHGLVNLCLAATLPTARRRGAWESLVWARIDDGPGLPAAAFTSDDSRPGFVRMGFLPVTRFTLWLRP
jgi:hypothetical protein